MRNLLRPLPSALLLALLLGHAPDAHATNDTVPGELRIDPPTLHSLGFAWFIAEDDDRDCQVTVEYRPVGDTTWRPAMDLFRVENALISGDVHPGNLLAGSIFGLPAGTEFEIHLVLADPDGGSADELVTATTRAQPPATDLSSVRHVAPGDGGGTGTESDPLLGLASADAAAQPGDVFLLAAGSYAPHSFDTDGADGAPITYRGVEQSTVLIDGGGTPDNVVGIGSRRFLVFENLTVRNGQRGIFGADTEGIVVRHVRLEDIVRNDGDPIGIWLGGASTNGYVCDNTLDGPADWVGQEYGPDSFGIKVSGSGHDVCHNAVTAFWDDIGMANDSTADTGISIDIYRNLLLDASDDSIETDYAQRNIRVIENKLANSLKGVSCQPVYGGPVYIVRNQMFNTRDSAYKFHVNPSGMLVLHNSSAAVGRAFGGGEWSNAVFRNNLFYGTAGYVMETLGALEDFDYNGWAPHDPPPVLKFNDVRYDTINADCDNPSNPDDWCAQTGHDRHSIAISLADWVNVAAPVGYAAAPPRPADWDYTLTAASGAVDTAELMPNLNDTFEGAGPDIGALELGAPEPQIGPRDDWEDPAPGGYGGSGGTAGAGGAATGGSGTGATATGGSGTGATTTGGNGTGASSTGPGASPAEDSGCGCKVAGSGSTAGAAAWLALAGFGALRRANRNRRPPRSCSMNDGGCDGSPEERRWSL